MGGIRQPRGADLRVRGRERGEGASGAASPRRDSEDGAGGVAMLRRVRALPSREPELGGGGTSAGEATSSPRPAAAERTAE